MNFIRAIVFFLFCFLFAPLFSLPGGLSLFLNVEFVGAEEPCASLRKKVEKNRNLLNSLDVGDEMASQGLNQEYISSKIKAAACECAEDLAVEAKNATSGMDMDSFVAVNQVTTTAVQTVSEGKSAKIAHTGNAAINSALTAAALKRYAECSAAISDCEEKCTVSEERPLPQSDPAGVEEARRKKILASCMENRRECSQSGLQALVSGITAATSILAAKQLSNCEGGKCNEGDGNNGSNSITPPKSPDQSTIGAGPYAGDGATKADNSPYNFPENQGNPDSSSGTTAENTGYKPPTSSSPNSPPNSPPSGNTPRGGFDKLADDSSASTDSGTPYEDEEDWEEEEESEGRYSPSLVTGAFAGGKTNSYSGYNRPRSGRGSSSYRSSFGDKKKKLASAGKNTENLKREIFRKTASQGSIFEKMSRVIISFCAQGKERCQ